MVTELWIEIWKSIAAITMLAILIICGFALSLIASTGNRPKLQLA